MFNSFLKELFTWICYVLMTIAFTSLTSCQKENAGKLVQDRETILTKIIHEDDFLELEHDQEGRVNSVTTTLLSEDELAVKYIIVYGPGNRIKELTGNDGMIITPVYDAGLLIRTHFNRNGDHLAYANYHMENGAPQEVTLYSRAGDTFDPVLSYRLKYNAAGNVSESVLMSAGDIPGRLVREGHIAYTYDEKENPLYTSRELLLLLMQTVSKNNVIKEEYYNQDLVMEDRYRYTYTYKENGLPLKAVIRTGTDDSDTGQKEVRYFYR